MAATGPNETEVKIRISSAEAAEGRVRQLGFEVLRPKVFEANVVFDTPDSSLKRAGKLLRLRRAGDTFVVTYKGPVLVDRHKSRPETEFAVSSFEACDLLFRQLGYEAKFRYEKYRTEYARSGTTGVVTVDDTPIGAFLEIEGTPEFIDATAQELGFTEADYVLASYGALYLQYCQEQGVVPTHMVFA
jgi:adenylate cyclase class 2